MLPDYERKLAEQEAEYQREMTRRGQLEGQRSYDENTTLDLLGFRDGRSGLDPGLFGENAMEMKVWLIIAVLAVIVVVAGQLLKGSRLDPDAGASVPAPSAPGAAAGR